MGFAKKRKIYISIAVALVVLATIAVAFSTVYAKYVKNERFRENQIKAENFYFTVDIFENEEEAEKTIHIYGIVSQIPFSVQNYFDSKRVNEEEITYEIKMEGVEVTSGISLHEVDNSEISENSYTLNGDAEETHQYYLQMADGAQYSEGDTAVITIKSTNPSSYEKEMKLNFVFHNNSDDLLYRVEDQEGSPYAKLIIMANRTIPDEAIEVNWETINKDANVLMVDTTNPHVLDVTPSEVNDSSLELKTNDPQPQGGYLSSIKITEELRELESVMIYFFKDDMNKDYSTDKDDNGVYKSISALKTVAEGSGEASYKITLEERKEPTNE